MAEPAYTLPPELLRLMELLEVLRLKAFKLALVAIVAFSVGFYFSENIIAALKDLLLPQGAKVVVLSPIEFMLLQIKIGSIAALLAILPPVAYFLVHSVNENPELELQIELTWSTAISIFLAALLLFLAGVAYALGFMLPMLLGFLYTDAQQAGLVATYSLGEFLHFALLMTFATGLSFELPLVVFSLVRSELFSYSQLAEYRRHVFVVFFILAAFITPPDVVSQLVLALPMSLLFEATLALIKFLDQKKVLAEKGLYLDHQLFYPRRGALLLGGYAVVLWVTLSVALYGLFWEAFLEGWPLSPERGWLLDRETLLENAAFIMLPWGIFLGTVMAGAVKGRLNYRVLERSRPLLYLVALLMVALAVPDDGVWARPFILLGVPVLVGLEAALALFRQASIYKLPEGTAHQENPSGKRVELRP